MAVHDLEPAAPPGQGFDDLELEPLSILTAVGARIDWVFNSFLTAGGSKRGFCFTRHRRHTVVGMVAPVAGFKVFTVFAIFHINSLDLGHPWPTYQRTIHSLCS